MTFSMFYLFTNLLIYYWLIAVMGIKPKAIVHNSYSISWSSVLSSLPHSLLNDMLIFSF
jgi:hypothetical protein